MDINHDHVQQARRKVEASQGAFLVYSWILSVNKPNVFQAPKKAKAEDDDDTKALKEKQKADAAALAAAKDRGERRPCCAYDKDADLEDLSSVEGSAHASRHLPIIPELTN